MASGDPLFELFPKSSVPTTTVAAAPDTMPDGSTVVGQISVLDYAGAVADEHGEWSKKMPPQYSGGGLTFEIEYAMDGTDGSDIQFEVRAIQQIAGDAIGSQDLQGQTATDITDTPNGTADIHDVTPTGAITHANAGSPAIGDYVRMRISRDFDHAANADKAQFISCLVTET